MCTTFYCFVNKKNKKQKGSQFDVEEVTEIPVIQTVHLCWKTQNRESVIVICWNSSMLYS